MSPISVGRTTLIVMMGIGAVAATASAQIEFEPRRELPFPVTPTWVAAPADWDGDGDIDVIAVIGETTAQRRIAVALGDGRGGFAPGASRAIEVTGYFLSVGDFDGDGALDIAIDRGFGPPYGVTVVLGDGAGGFGPQTGVTLAGIAQNVEIADFDSDGADELLAIAESFLYLIEFEPPRALTARVLDFHPSYWDCAVGDFNEDDRPDFAASIGTERYFRAFLGDGAGEFEAPRTVSSNPGCPGPLLVADENEDGHLDIIAGLMGLGCSSQRDGEVAVFLGDGTGTFQSNWITGGYIPNTGSDYADLDGDDRGDLAHLSGFGLVVYLGLDGPEFEFRRVIVPDIDWGPYPLAWIDVADFDGDDLMDMLSPTGVHLNRSPSAAQAAVRVGNVDARGSGPTDVLFVNGSPGTGRARKVVAHRTVSFAIEMAGPPSNPLGPALFALYAWLDIPVGNAPVTLPFGLGDSALPMPPSGGGLTPRPRHVWNNLGYRPLLGVPTLPSVPAPSVVLSKPGGLRADVDFFLQGILLDSAAPNGRAAVTNGVLVTVRY